LNTILNTNHSGLILPTLARIVFREGEALDPVSGSGRTAAHLIVMSEHSSQFLQDIFRVPVEKIDLIPHGIPDLPFAEPAFYKQAFSTEGRTVLLTFGLLSPHKGFESVIQALPRILSRHSNVGYMIAGATHPQVRRREGDRYQLKLRASAKELGGRRT
jgi:glycosyltransferase involved in cell wall biosynthesis